jgi:hypothetical protein
MKMPAHPPIRPVLAVLAGALLAQAATGSWQAIGQIGGATQVIAADAWVVYAGTGRRLVLLDPANGLRELGHTAVYSDLVEGVAVQNNLAFVACGKAGVHIVDVSNPSALLEVATVTARGPADGVAVSGATLYVANGPYGLLLYDISNPAQPVPLGSAFPTHNVLKVALNGGRAYLAAAGAGLLVADVHDPSHPVELGTLATSGFSFDIAVSGSTAYVADGWAGLRSVNVADPSHPIENAALKTGCWAMGVGLAAGRAYVADSCAGLAVVDASRRDQLARVAQYSTDSTDARAVAVSGGTVYLADRNWGVRAFSERQLRRGGRPLPAIPWLAETATHAFVSDVHDVDAQGNYAYVAAGFAGLRVIDLTQPSAPQEVGAFLTQSYTMGVAVQGNYAYLITGQQAKEARGVYIVDVSDPRNPAQAGYFYLEPHSTVYGAGWAIRVSGNYAYIANELGIGILDVSQPSNPVWVDLVPTGAFFVAVDGSRAYSVGGGFAVVDTGNPLAPALLSLSTQAAQGVAAHGSLAYLATGQGLTIMDVSDGAHPTQVGSYNLGGSYGVDIAGSLAYLSVASGLVAVDVSVPANPVTVAQFESPGFAYSVRSIGNLIYLPDSEGGLVILPRADSPAASTPAPALGQSLGLDSGGLRPYTAAAIESADDPLPAALAAPPPPAPGPTCTVSAATDSGPGSIRDCLGKTPSGGTVTFDPAVFPASGQPKQILLSSPLQLDKGWITLDASNAAVMLMGNGAGYAGVAITSPGNTVKGLQVTGFAGGGIVLTGGAAHNQIGGDRHAGSGPTGEGNAIWNNGQGLDDSSGLPNLLLDGAGAYDNLIAGNVLGPDPSTMTEPIWGPGMELKLQNGAMWNRIGTGAPGGANMIGAAPVMLRDAATAHNRIQGNSVGATVQGTASLSTMGGTFWVIEASYNMVGGTNPNEGNLLAGSSSHAIDVCNFARGNQIVGNTIGVDVTGTKVIGLGGQVQAVWLEVGAYDNILDGNTIAGSGGGVALLLFGTNFNQLIGNRIGFDATGRFVLGNGGTAVTGLQTQYSRIGGSRQQDRNLLLTGQGMAVGVDQDLGGIFLGNYVGANADGVAVTSQTDGIALGSGTRRSIIGGATGPEGNLILGTWSWSLSVNGKRHVVQSNVLGIDLQGNLSPDPRGISAGGGSAPDVSGRDIIVQGNTIVGNSGYGGQSTFGDRNTFRRNSLYGNRAGLALFCADATACLAVPVLLSVSTTSVSGTACPACEVEVFSDAGSQGRYFEASGIANAQGAFSIALSTPPRGPNVTATATDPDGNTSQFSNPWQLTK